MDWARAWLGKQDLTTVDSVLVGVAQRKLKCSDAGWQGRSLTMGAI
jgi:hypothetical protein